jgi:hypothetical protein
VGWSTSSSYQSDTKAFIFQLQKRTKMEPTQSLSNSVYGASGYGPTFGGGHDLYICDNANTTNSSYTNLGHTYKAPVGTTYGQNDAMNYMAGTYNFMIDEIEVYKIPLTE